MVSVRGHGPSNPELDALVSQLWISDADGPVRADIAAARSPATPDGFVEVERYAVVPNVRRAKFLVPLVSRRAAAASLLRYNRLRSPRTAAARGALGACFLVGAGRLFPDVLSVRVDASVAADDLGDYLLTARLARELAAPVVAAGIGVRPLDPNSKPTLQLFDPGGTPLGYAKIGWNDATRQLVSTEAETLRSVGTQSGDRALAFATPRVLADGVWAGRRYVVTSPLPTGIERHRVAHRPPSPAVLFALAGPLTSTSLTASGYWSRLQAELATLTADADFADLVSALRGYVDALAAQWGATDLQFGRWHGDWVPWNLGWHHAQLHVWDWEHSSLDAPLGLDLAHWHFQVAFVLQRKPLAEALDDVRRTCAKGWSELGVDAPAGRAVSDLYLAELALRTARLRRGGGGWNAGLYPALLTALAEAPVGHRPEAQQRSASHTQSPQRTSAHTSAHRSAFGQYLGETP